MSKEAASADLQAAAYWKGIARSDRTEIELATVKVGELTAAARKEKIEPTETRRRSRGLGAG